jgi:LPXTG-motif cell wall-anchored protein
MLRRLGIGNSVLALAVALTATVALLMSPAWAHHKADHTTGQSAGSGGGGDGGGGGSDPDGTSNGGYDGPGGEFGEYDANNGCGNDVHQDDIDDSDAIGEDDNNGKCQGLDKQKDDGDVGTGAPGGSGGGGSGSGGSGGTGGGGTGGTGGFVGGGLAPPAGGTGGGGGDRVLDRLVNPSSEEPPTGALGTRSAPDSEGALPLTGAGVTLLVIAALVLIAGGVLLARRGRGVS